MLKKITRATKRIVIGVFGGLLLCVGIVMIPYPGPGWLVVFASLAILATEFEWARRIHAFGRRKYDAWEKWLSQQSRYVKALFWCSTALVVVMTIWLLNGYGIMNSLLGLKWNWLNSPLPFF